MEQNNHITLSSAISSSLYSNGSMPETAKKCPTQQTTLYGLCRPFLVLMRLGGMFFIQPDLPEKSSNNNGQSSNSAQSSVTFNYFNEKVQQWRTFERSSMIYSFILFAVGLTYCAKYIYTFVVGVSGLSLTKEHLSSIVSHTCYFMWIVQQLTVHAIFIMACWRPSKVTELFRRWEDLRYTCAQPDVCKFPSFGEDFGWRRNVVSFLAVFHCICQWMSIDFALIIPSKEVCQVTLRP